MGQNKQGKEGQGLPERSSSPDEKSPQAASQKKGKRFNIDIFQAWCKSCGICAAFCPRDCIELDEEGSPVITQPDRCTGCGWCEIHCPDFAISVRPRKQEEADKIRKSA